MRFAPEDAAPIDLLDRGQDAVHRAVAVHRQFAGFKTIVVVNYCKPTGAEAGIKLRQRSPGRFVHVAIQPNQRETFASEAGKGVFEPALVKSHLIIEELVSAKSFFHLGAGHGEFRVLMKYGAGVCGIAGGVGWRKAAKAVGHMDNAVRNAARRQDAANKYARAAAPNPGFNEVAGNPLVQQLLDRASKMR